VICLRNVSYTYPNGIKALKEVSVKIDENTFISGLTASGKSTLLRIFNGLIPNFYGGSIKGSVDIDSSPYLIFQNPDEQIIMNGVFDELAVQAIQSGRDLEDVRKISNLLKIDDIIYRKTDELSDGQKRLVTIALALISNCDMIVLDEPFSNLYPELAKRILKILLKSEKVVVMSEHRIEFSKYFDELYWVENGRISSLDDISLEKPCLSDGCVDTGRSGEVLRVEDLTFGFDSILFKDISFELNRGEICAIIGENGCGKTTLLRLIAGLLRPWSGEIHVKGSVSICYSNPHYHLFEKRVGDEIDVSIFDLKCIENRNPNSLSFGEAKRVAISKAFKADILLLDEPSAGQDFLFKRKLIDVAKRLNKTVIMATHDLSLARDCDVIVKL